MESDSEDDEDIFDDDRVVDPSFSCSSESSLDNENEYTKPRKKYKDDPMSSRSSGGKGAKDRITENESSVPALSNEQASFPTQERSIQMMSSSSSAEHLEDQKTPLMSKKQNKSPRDIVWKSKNLVLPDCQSKFLGNDQLPSHISDLKTPYEFFSELFTESLIDHIVQETIRYNVQLNPGKPQEITKDDIRKYIGICIVMSYINVPSCRDYWRQSFGNKLVQETMSVNHFEKIRKCIHFANNEDAAPQKEPGYDSLFKIRPVVEELRKNFKKVPMEECLSIEEQVCPTKARSYSKQYLPSKPYKWDYKLVVLCGVSGYSYDFEIYTGRENNPTWRLSNEPDLGAFGNIVVHLSRGIPKNCNYKVYCDNYYTSVDLFVHLAKQGIYSLGTVKKNRIPNNKLPSESEMKKKERGAAVEMVATVEGVDVSCVTWKDNKVVLLLSTLSGEIPLSETDRFDNTRNVAIKCPNFVKHYNKYMGRVDLLNSLLGRYENRMRSKKWYLQIFYHLLDVTAVNAWLLYRRVHGDKMRLADFREEVAESLCKIGHTNVAKRGRSCSNTEQQIQMKKKRGCASHVPVKNVRLDNISHWPDWKPTRQRCKMPQCKSLTYVHCSKCGVALCLNKDKNCFAGFHTT